MKKKEPFIVTEDVPGINVRTKSVLKKGDVHFLDPERAKGVKALKKATASELKAYRSKDAADGNTEPPEETTNKEVA